MRTSAPRWTRRLTGAAVAALVIFQACTDGATRPDPTVAFASGGGGGGPSVDAADPDTATQDTTLDVRVIGSGFDDGSTVALLLAGQSTPKIVTNSTRFVDRNTLIANITIAADADTALYDLEVTTSRGKKGQGSELFSVKKKRDAPTEFYGYEDLGVGSAQDISDGAVILGTDESGTVLRYPDGSVRSLDPPGFPLRYFYYGYDMNDAATLVVGAADDSVPLIWDATLGGTPTLLPLLAGLPAARAYAVNDVGQVVGTNSDFVYPPQTTRKAVLWERDGSGAWTVRALPALQGYSRQFAKSINNDGVAVGKVFSDNYPDDLPAVKPRAVLWRIDPDGQAYIMDLTPDSDDSGDNHALALTDVAADGTVMVAGRSSLAGIGYATVWTVDVQSMTIIGRRTLPSRSAWAIADVGEVLVSSPDAVWDLSDDAVRPLSQPAGSCAYYPAAMSAVGVLVGRAQFPVATKGKRQSTPCSATSEKVDHVIRWTRIE